MIFKKVSSFYRKKHKSYGWELRWLWALMVVDLDGSYSYYSHDKAIRSYTTD